MRRSQLADDGERAAAADGAPQLAESVVQDDAPRAAAWRPDVDETAAKAVVHEDRALAAWGIARAGGESTRRRPFSSRRKTQHTSARLGAARRDERVVVRIPLPRPDLLLFLPGHHVVRRRSRKHADEASRGNPGQGAGPERVAQLDAIDHAVEC